MKLRISELPHQVVPPKIAIQSFEGSIYRMVARVESETFVIVDDHNEIIVERHPENLKAMIKDYVVDSITLEHSSAYDEMIGLPSSEEPNMLVLGEVLPNEDAIEQEHPH